MSGLMAFLSTDGRATAEPAARALVDTLESRFAGRTPHQAPY